VRYIKKTAAPDFFTADTKNLNTWDQYGKVKGTKRCLKQHIIDHEQYALCVYCESKINPSDSHIEHIKPKGKNGYPELTFDYKNLAVSCNGNLHNQADDHKQRSCGHKKDNEYDESLFLDPTQLTDISDYFVYDVDDGQIDSSDKAVAKARYAIDILNLNKDGLPQARGNALKALRQSLRKIKDTQQRKATLIAFINGQNRPFVSFLRFNFRAILA
jgi:uncharacterized protein (TIGR02646 family)